MSPWWWARPVMATCSGARNEKTARSPPWRCARCRRQRRAPTGAIDRTSAMACWLSLAVRQTQPTLAVEAGAAHLPDGAGATVDVDPSLVVIAALVGDALPAGALVRSSLMR